MSFQQLKHSLEVKISLPSKGIKEEEEGIEKNERLSDNFFSSDE